MELGAPLEAARTSCPLWVISGHVQCKTRMSALPPIADMCSATRDVRFVPKADILRRRSDYRTPIETDDVSESGGG